MVSKDFKKLANLVYNQGYKVCSIDINITSIPEKSGLFPTTRIVLKKDDKEVEFESKEEDVLEYGFSLKHTADEEGNIEFMRYKDLNKFYDDVDFLIDKDKKKLSKAIRKIKNEDFRFSYDPEKLFEEFLLSNRRTSTKFEKLKTDYFEILAYFLLLSKKHLDIQQQTKSFDPKFKEYCKLIDEILMKAFRTDPNFVKNYLKYSKCINLNLKNLADKAIDQSKYIKDLFDMLVKREKVEGHRGVRYLLDIYRRVSEILSEFINAIRISIELIAGNETPDTYKSYVDNCRIIKDHGKYSKLIDCLDPRIRHSESHINTEIDKTLGKVILTENKRNKKVKIREYTFREITDMTRSLEKGLFPAFLSSFYLHKIVVSSVILTSKEYLLLLLGIGNRR